MSKKYEGNTTAGYEPLDPQFVADVWAAEAGSAIGIKRATALIDVLADHVMYKQKPMSYAEAGGIAGCAARSVNQYATLHELERMCQERKWPNLAVMVVNSGTGLHSAANWRGIHSQAELRAEMQRCLDYFGGLDYHLARRAQQSPPQ